MDAGMGGIAGAVEDVVVAAMLDGVVAVPEAGRVAVTSFCQHGVVNLNENGTWRT